MNKKGEFEIPGMIVSRESVNLERARKIDLVVRDKFGKRHYLQARPNQFESLQKIKDLESAKFIVTNEYGFHHRHYNNLILKRIALS